MVSRYSYDKVIVGNCNIWLDVDGSIEEKESIEKLCNVSWPCTIDDIALENYTFSKSEKNTLLRRISFLSGISGPVNSRDGNIIKYNSKDED